MRVDSDRAYGTTSTKVVPSDSRSVRPDEEATADLDDAELEASGYHREMPRQFSMLSLLALTYALLCTWNGFGRSVKE